MYVSTYFTVYVHTVDIIHPRLVNPELPDDEDRFLIGNIYRQPSHSALTALTANVDQLSCWLSPILSLNLQLN